jgi:hypothetical protein
VWVLGRHSARGKKKDLVRGLQRLGGSWWRALKIELILVEYEDVCCYAGDGRRDTCTPASYPVALAAPNGSSAARGDWRTMVAGKWQSHVAQERWCQRGHREAPFTTPSGWTLRKDYSTQTDHLHSHLEHYICIHFRWTAGNNCCNSHVK